MALQHLRSSTADKRPTPAAMSDGQLALNTHTSSPGLFFKDSNGDSVKIGPVHVGTTAPNATPGAGGQAGNSKGEQWLDTSSSRYVFKIWDGTAWRTEDGEFVNASGDTMTGALVMDNQQQVRFRETTANGTNSIALQAPAAVASDKTITLPDATGTLVLSGTIVNADINASAAIVDTKLATISTAGKVSNSATTADSANTASAIVARDASGNFAAGDITIGDKIIHAGDTDTAIRFPAADTVTVETDGSERARIDSSGRLLVGTSTARSVGQVTQPIQQESTSDTGIAFVRNSSGDVLGSYVILAKSRGASTGSNTVVQSEDQLGALVFAGADGTDVNTQAAVISAYVDGTPGADDMPGRLVFSTTADGASTPTERMRIASNGSIFFAATSASSITSGAANGKFINSSGEMYSSRLTTGAASHIIFYNPNGYVGQISTTAAATSYATSSDYRLKENVTLLDGAIARLNQLPVHRFNFIADPDTVVDGFIAHEAAAVVPECVTGEKDEEDENGDPVYQGIDQSKVVPLLTAALQEAIAKIDALEARIAALEA